MQFVGEQLLRLVDPQYLVGHCVPLVPELPLPVIALLGLGFLPLLHFSPHPLPIQLFLPDIVLVMHVVVLQRYAGIVCDVSGVEEVAADEGRVDVVLIGPAVLVGAVESSVFLLLVELFVDVDSSAGRRARLLAVVGGVAHLNSNNYWAEDAPQIDNHST